MKPADYTADQLLSRYIDGRLTAPEEAELERRALVDQDLGASFAAIRAQPEEDHITHLQHIRARTQGQTKSKGSTAVYRQLAAVAAIGLLVFAAIFLLPFGLEDKALATQQEPVPASSDVAVPPELAVEETENPKPDVTEAIVEDEVAIQSNASPPPPPPPALPATSAPASAPEKYAEGVEVEILAEAEPPAIISRKARSEIIRSPKISGFVLDEEGQPIPDVVLDLPGLPTPLRTDSAGGFTLNVSPVAAGELGLSLAGYESETVELKQSTDARLQITLDRVRERSFADDLGSAAAVKLESDARGMLMPAPPPMATVDGGVNALRRRIEVEKPADLPGGKLRVSFLVGPDGKTSDFRFRGKSDDALIDYVGKNLSEAGWRIENGERPVRVFMKFRF